MSCTVHSTVQFSSRDAEGTRDTCSGVLNLYCGFELTSLRGRIAELQTVSELEMLEVQGFLESLEILQHWKPRSVLSFSRVSRSETTGKASSSKLNRAESNQMRSVLGQLLTRGPVGSRTRVHEARVFNVINLTEFVRPRPPSTLHRAVMPHGTTIL